MTTWKRRGLFACLLFGLDWQHSGLDTPETKQVHSYVAKESSEKAVTSSTLAPNAVDGAQRFLLAADLSFSVNWYRSSS